MRGSGKITGCSSTVTVWTSPIFSILNVYWGLKSYFDLFAVVSPLRNSRVSQRAIDTESEDREFEALTGIASVGFVTSRSSFESDCRLQPSLGAQPKAKAATPEFDVGGLFQAPLISNALQRYGLARQPQAAVSPTRRLIPINWKMRSRFSR